MKIIKLADFDSIYYVDVFFQEYMELFGKSRNTYESCLKKLRTNLRILDTEKKKVITYRQFEKLQESDVYSIRHVCQDNDRVIFAFIDEDDDVILLSSCKEKNTSDYHKAISRAEERLRILMEEN